VDQHLAHFAHRISPFAQSRFNRRFDQSFYRLKPTLSEEIAMNTEAFLTAPFVVQLHVFSAVGALLLGSIQMFAPKGNLPHRTMGILFVLLMASAAISAIFIRQINGGNFSFVHIFVPLTIIGVFRLVLSARRGDRTGHRGQVMGLFYGALIMPGLLSFIPGRLMYNVFMGG
tara:strand:- start:5551 stop:6066 length:516 start_codon:yes stop_codon:yes gene_type:complete